MTPERWRQVTDVFHAALARDAAAREALLDERCAGDADLRAQVEGLLAAHEGAGQFGEGPALVPDGGLEALVEELSRSGDVAGPSGMSAAASPDAGGSFGPYRVVGELGEGGMGVVHLAERSDGQFTRRVAIKRVGSTAPRIDLLRRFRDEREILARLDHPNIARLLDAGIDDAGVPYLVMEHVEGAPVTTYCRERALAVRPRLELFLKVCGAVQHAHQNLVIHRDIKPANILVTPGAEPKLLDFGIAKLMDEARAGDPTRTMDRAFTLDFASPEQVRGEPVTTASDVYSLGVLLYELMADARPYETHGLSLPEAVRLVCETVPPPPSRAAPAERRGELVGDLDNIAQKALHQEPAGRYATAAALADDIRRHLDGFPVRARPDGRAYRMAKFLRRHRAGAAAAAVALIGLVSGLAVAVRQARVAEAERRRAEARFQDVRRLANSVLHDLHDAIANVSGSTPLRRVLVTRALEYLDRLGREAPDDVALRRELADGYQRIAQVQGGGMGANLGDTPGAIESYGKALGIRRDLAGGAAAEAADIVALGLLELELGALQRAQGHLDEAGQSYRSAAGRLKAVADGGLLRASQRDRLGVVYQRLAELETFRGRPQAALPWAEQAVAETERLWHAAPGDATARTALAQASCQLASTLAGLGRQQESLDRARAARALLEAGLRDDPLDASQTRTLLFALHREGEQLRRLGDTRGSIEVRERALAVAEETLRHDPTDRWSQMGVAVAAGALGSVLLDTRETHAAERYYRRALRISNRAVAEDPRYTFARLQAASAEHGLGRALVAQRTTQSLAEGCARLESVRTYWSGLHAEGELPPGEAADLASLEGWLARCVPTRTR
jgi:non-specific serine/threonine protein kinase/serine/threonine-protein kinase